MTISSTDQIRLLVIADHNMTASEIVTKLAEMGVQAQSNTVATTRAGTLATLKMLAKYQAEQPKAVGKKTTATTDEVFAQAAVDDKKMAALIAKEKAEGRKAAIADRKAAIKEMAADVAKKAAKPAKAPKLATALLGKALGKAALASAPKKGRKG